MAKQKKITYAGVKGQFVNDRMREGKTNDQARKMWKKSEEAKQFKFPGYPDRNGLPGPEDGVFIDRSYDSPCRTTRIRPTTFNMFVMINISILNVYKSVRQVLKTYWKLKEQDLIIYITEHGNMCLGDVTTKLPGDRYGFKIKSWKDNPSTEAGNDYE